jgi:hypothetical protein
MAPRDTRTGAVLENMILHSLTLGGYTHTNQTVIGLRPGGRKHKVDSIADKNGERFLVSLKWQQVGGTAEEKVPFEIICLMQAVLTSKGEYKKAYLVLGGDGWTLRSYYVGGGLKEFINYDGSVEIVTLEQFVAIANKGNL